jgi:pimeloyl-ACP methyl ester carboxylesterase
MAGTSADSEASQTERLVDVAGESIRYWEAGAGEVVVILDGLGAGMAQLQDALAGKYRVIRLEPDGTGTSKDVAYQMVQAVREITSGKITLIAASGSANAAIWHALEATQAVGALVLISPVAVLPAGEADGGRDAGLESRMGEIECATLVVFGLNDRTIAPEAAGVYKASISNCHVSLVYDAGHNIMADRPEALIDVVSDFVERGEAFIVARHSGLINP